MSVLSEDRAAIAEAVDLASRGVSATPRVVHQFVPDRLIPPAAIITPSDPYLERRTTDPFGTLTASWEIWLVQGAGANETVTTELDDAIEAHAEALTGAGFALERVSEPFMYAVGNSNFLASVLYVTTGVTLTT